MVFLVHAVLVFLVDVTKQLLHRPGHQPRLCRGAKHGVGLATPGLPVTHDGAVDALQDVVDGGGTRGGVTLFLGGIVVEDVLKLTKVPRVVQFPFGQLNDACGGGGGVCLVHLDARFAIGRGVVVFGDGGAYPQHDFHGADAVGGGWW